MQRRYPPPELSGDGEEALEAPATPCVVSMLVAAGEDPAVVPMEVTPSCTMAQDPTMDPTVDPMVTDPTAMDPAADTTEASCPASSLGTLSPQQLHPPLP